MSKIAFIFPGQGAQYVGMGQDFYEQYEEAREVFDLASKATGLDLNTLCFTENEDLNITKYTQPAMLATEIAILKVLESKGIKADVCAGLSLGEYGALATANVMELEDLFKLIRMRGIFMEEAYPNGGAMTAVLGMDGEKVAEICEQTDGIVGVANYNCPGQIVISGEEKAVQKAAEKLSEAGAKRCIPLKVSGPFHSPLLSGASTKLKEVLLTVEVKKPEIPYVCNVEAAYVTEKESIVDLLAKQVASSVKWQQSVEEMIAQGVDTFIEIGPGKTLSGFMKKINKEVKTYNIDKVDDLNKVLEELGC